MQRTRTEHTKLRGSLAVIVGAGLALYVISRPQFATHRAAGFVLLVAAGVILAGGVGILTGRFIRH
jgi:hypothetical protein